MEPDIAISSTTSTSYSLGAISIPFNHIKTTSIHGSSLLPAMSIGVGQSSFNRLPPVVRERIFRTTLDFKSWYTEFPPLIAALRGEPHLYHEALAVLFKYNKFKLDGWTENLFMNTHQNCVAKIKHLTVFIDKAPFYPDKDFNPDHLWFQKQLLRFTGLENLIIHCASHANSDDEIITDFVRFMPEWLKTTKVSQKLKIVIPYSCLRFGNPPSWLPIALRDQLVDNNIKEVDSTLGVEGTLVEEHRCEHVGTPEWQNFRHHIVDEDEWVWEATENEILDFTQDA